jgi:hypothetical protein
VKGMIQHYRIEIQIRRQSILRFSQTQLPKWHIVIRPSWDERLNFDPATMIKLDCRAPGWFAVSIRTCLSIPKISNLPPAGLVDVQLVHDDRISGAWVEKTRCRSGRISRIRGGTCFD